MNIRLLLLIVALLLSSCASTQKMHFAEFTPVDYQVSNLSKSLGISEKLSIGTVTGGDYSSRGEYDNYSWHGFVDGFYEGFLPLPYDDTNRQVKLWITDLLERDGLLTKAISSPSINVYVKRLKIKNQKDHIGNDYRACLVELNLNYIDNHGSIVREVTVEGLAKLHGSDLQIIDKKLLSIRVAFSPDDPPVCKLAVANALQANPK